MTDNQETRIIDKCRHRDTDRFFLYWMVFICMLNSFNIGSTVKEAVREELRRVEQDKRIEQVQETQEEPITKSRTTSWTK